MNQIMYKEINVNKVLYKTLTTTHLYSKSMRSLFKSVKHKKRVSWRTGPFHPTELTSQTNRTNTSWWVQKVSLPHLNDGGSADWPTGPDPSSHSYILWLFDKIFLYMQIIYFFKEITHTTSSDLKSRDSIARVNHYIRGIVRFGGQRCI